ncbi:MAG: HAMP domain-containing histidine kinase [Defluviitaleaceae bacterium]|nr:HAMP domain-containing histidine kinase [Defluviitaleaceae bacterium]
MNAELSQIDFPEMTGALAHEIKNPAAVALAHINLMRQKQTTPTHGLEPHLNHIEQALMDICELVQDMLYAVYNFSEPYAVDVTDMFHEMLEIYRAAWPSISFSLNTSTQLTCIGQESSIRLVFSNLIKNAVEAVEGVESACIEISASNTGKFLNISIYNNGAVEGSMTKSHGNGLGLAICRHILTQLGGHLQIDTSHQKEGFTITVALPTGNA